MGSSCSSTAPVAAESNTAPTPPAAPEQVKRPKRKFKAVFTRGSLFQLEDSPIPSHGLESPASGGGSAPASPWRRRPSAAVSIMTATTHSRSVQQFLDAWADDSLADSGEGNLGAAAELGSGALPLPQPPRRFPASAVRRASRKSDEYGRFLDSVSDSGSDGAGRKRHPHAVTSPRSPVCEAQYPSGQGQQQGAVRDSACLKAFKFPPAQSEESQPASGPAAGAEASDAESPLLWNPLQTRLWSGDRSNSNSASGVGGGSGRGARGNSSGGSCRGSAPSDEDDQLSLELPVALTTIAGVPARQAPALCVADKSVSSCEDKDWHDLAKPTGDGPIPAASAAVAISEAQLVAFPAMSITAHGEEEDEMEQQQPLSWPGSRAGANEATEASNSLVSSVAYPGSRGTSPTPQAPPLAGARPRAMSLEGYGRRLPLAQASLPPQASGQPNAPSKQASAHRGSISSSLWLAGSNGSAEHWPGGTLAPMCPRSTSNNSASAITAASSMRPLATSVSSASLSAAFRALEAIGSTSRILSPPLPPTSTSSDSKLATPTSRGSRGSSGEKKDEQGSQRSARASFAAGGGDAGSTSTLSLFGSPHAPAPDAFASPLSSATGLHHVSNERDRQLAAATPAMVPSFRDRLVM